jgi:hypothetical protein
LLRCDFRCALYKKPTSGLKGQALVLRHLQVGVRIRMCCFAPHFEFLLASGAIMVRRIPTSSGLSTSLYTRLHATEAAS